MRIRNYLLIIAFLCTYPMQAQDRSEWFEFYLPWDDSTKTITDLSNYLDAPAGKHGFLEVTPEGHFSFENSDENIRFSGVVNVAKANFPDYDEAPVIAARMAKYGINMVRIHLIDVDWENGLFENSSQNTLILSQSRLDKMDYFIHCLKEKGIYYNFCIQAGRVFKAGDGIDSEILNSQSKYVSLFNDKLIELQKDFANKTLAHVNPYTGLAYVDDPGLAQVEMTNENQLYNGWFGWNRDYIFADTEGGIGPHYSAQLDTLFNEWLRDRYPDDDSLANTWSGADEGSKELLNNNSFEDGFTGWTPYIRTSEGAVAEFVIDDTASVDGNNSCLCAISNPGASNWHIHLKTNDFSVEAYESYKIEFYARSDSDQDFAIGIQENITWKWIAGPVFKTSDSWKKYVYYFTSPFDSDQLILQFNFGLLTGNYWLDSLSVTKSWGTGLEEGESLLLGNIKRTAASELGKHSNWRIGDNARFYYDVEGKYISTMMDYLKNSLGVKVPVTFTNNYFGLASIYSQSRSDYMDTHLYWDHPSFPGEYSNTNFTMKNRPMVKDPEGSTLNRFPFQRVNGKPLVLSEYNQPYPQIYQCEAPSILFAYGSYIDLDGIEWHAYYDFMDRYSQRYQDMFFDIAMHPVMMTQMMLSIPYRLSYIQPPENRVTAYYKEEDIFNNTKIFQDDEVLNIPGLDYGSSFLVDAFAHGDFSADSTYLEGALSNPQGPVVSEKDQLRWDGESGMVEFNVPYWQGATGFLGDKSIELNDISISEVSTTNNFDFGYVHLLALDSLPINESKRMILLTGARLENEGFLWNASQTSPADIGGTRALCEPLQANISLNFASRDSFMVYRLDERGQRSGLVFSADSSAEWSFNVNSKTLWYEILNDSASYHPQIDTSTVDTTIIDTTGIESRHLDLDIFPNPGNREIVISSQSGFPPGGSIFIFNIQGQVLIREELESQQSLGKDLTIDISALASGLYFLKIQSQGTYIAMNKFLKQEYPR